MSDLTPLEVVNSRMAAYNDHDLEAFLAVYSPTVDLYEFPDQLLGSGHDHLRMIFDPLFAAAVVHVDARHQAGAGSFIVNEELVTYEDRTQPYISIYEVSDGLIQSARFIRGAATSAA